MQNQNNDIILFVVVATGIIVFLVTFIFLILFLYQKKLLLFTKQLENTKNIYEKNLLEIQLEIQEQTFQNISREIHDNIGLSLTLAKLRLNTLNQNDHSTMSDNIESSIGLIGKAIIDLSHLSKGLDSEAIKTHGLYNTMKIETEKVGNSGKIGIDFSVEGNPVFLDAQKELVLYRIAQEALNNILKHANATHIWVSLTYLSGQVKMTIRDNGKGFDPGAVKQASSYKMSAGLNNMRIRANSINGTCEIDSVIGYGTTINIVTPY